MNPTDPEVPILPIPGIDFPREAVGSDAMTTRDYFAAQALTGIILASYQRSQRVATTWAPGSLPPAGETARAAYEYADAMIAEAKRNGGGA